MDVGEVLLRPRLRGAPGRQRPRRQLPVARPRALPRPVRRPAHSRGSGQLQVIAREDEARSEPRCIEPRLRIRQLYHG